MWILLTAVVTSSLLGSMHCVGMCGPLAIWASGAAETGGSAEGRSQRSIWISSTLYHVGRLLTYLLMGVVAGFLGQLIDVSGDAIGLQVATGRVVGVLMVGMGLYQLKEYLPTPRSGGALKPSRVGLLLVKLRPFVFRLPLPARAFATGLLTTFLPCGWLYLFALVAAGTASVFVAPVVMAAFWVGTVPALVGLVAGTRALSQRFRVAIPIIAALLLVMTGCFTASGRGFAAINSLSDLRESAGLNITNVSSEEIVNLNDAPLPCCIQHESSE